MDKFDNNIKISEEDLKNFRVYIQHAKDNHLWFHSIISEEWFSPEEIEEKLENGKYYVCSWLWQLKNPFDEIQRMTQEKTRLNEKIINMRSRIEKWGK